MSEQDRIAFLLQLWEISGYIQTHNECNFAPALNSFTQEIDALVARELENLSSCIYIRRDRTIQ